MLKEQRKQVLKNKINAISIKDRNTLILYISKCSLKKLMCKKAVAVKMHPFISYFSSLFIKTDLDTKIKSLNCII